MIRQKVKGTGHKQPADASSEPNFYAMPPVLPERPTGYEEMAPSNSMSSEPRNIEPISPGMQSVHGAAHLLHGIAAGFNYGKLPQAPFVGSDSPKEDDNQESRHRSSRPSASFLQPESH